MSSIIPFYEQFYYETSRNNKFAWLLFGLGLLTLLIYGVLFHWLEMYMRAYHSDSQHYRKIQRLWKVYTGSLKVRIWKKSYLYVQPSILILFAAYIAINASFAFVETVDLNYEPRYYIVGKRLGKIGTANFPVLFLFIAKNDLVPFLSGIPHDRLCFLHRWIGRFVWIVIGTHFTMTIMYWVNVGFTDMIYIPPQYFGMIAFCCMTITVWAGIRPLRTRWYEFFLFNHGASSGIMMLMSFFHNPSGRASILLAVHAVVLDRICSAVRVFMNRRVSPTKCKARAKVLDDKTVELKIPIAKKPPLKWSVFDWLFSSFRGNWKAGQHVYLRVSKAGRVQWHPFTIASSPNSGEIRLVIRVYTGFTKHLRDYIWKEEEKACGQDGSSVSDTSRNDNEYVEIKTAIHGPYGGRILPLTTFDTVLLVAGGSGGSFTLPVAYDLISELREKDALEDFCCRPSNWNVQVIWYVKNTDQIGWYRELIEAITELGVSVLIYITQQEQSVITRANSNSSNVSESKRLVSEVYDVGSQNSQYNVSKAQIEYRRRPVYEIVKTTAKAIKRGQSMAILSCGPSKLVSEISHATDYIRWKCSTDVYAYSEKYE